MIFEQAKITIELLVNNMVKPEISNTIFLNLYKELTVTNVVKILLRAK
jgi:hypothetical protein